MVVNAVDFERIVGFHARETGRPGSGAWRCSMEAKMPRGTVRVLVGYAPRINLASDPAALYDRCFYRDGDNDNDDDDDSVPERQACVFATVDEGAVGRCATVEGVGGDDIGDGDDPGLWTDMVTIVDVRLTPQRLADIARSCLRALMDDQSMVQFTDDAMVYRDEAGPGVARVPMWVPCLTLIRSCRRRTRRANWTALSHIVSTWPTTSHAQEPSESRVRDMFAYAPGPVASIPGPRVGVTIHGGDLAIVVVSDEVACDVSSSRFAADVLFDESVVRTLPPEVACARLVVFVNARTTDVDRGPVFYGPVSAVSATSAASAASAASVHRRCFVGGVPLTSIATCSHALYDYASVARYAGDFGTGPGGAMFKDARTTRSARARSVRTIALLANELSPRIRERLWRPGSELVRELARSWTAETWTA